MALFFRNMNISWPRGRGIETLPHSFIRDFLYGESGLGTDQIGNFSIVGRTPSQLGGSELRYLGLPLLWITHHHELAGVLNGEPGKSMQMRTLDYAHDGLVHIRQNAGEDPAQDPKPENGVPFILATAEQLHAKRGSPGIFW